MKNPQRNGQNSPMRHARPEQRVAARTLQIFLCSLLCLPLFVPGFRLSAQSGRRNQPRSASPPAATRATRPKRVEAQTPSQDKPAAAQPLPEMPAAVPIKITNPTAPSGTTATAAGEIIGEDDVVRIDSNLVAVLASAVDSQGKAVTDLKLEDFELRVDGQPKPIGDIGYSETPVSMAVLFDNSSSVSPARKFQLQAAVQFFKSVMRPVDQAAIYSVSTYPALVRPLTNDIQILVRTIESFAKPEGATALFDAIAQAADYLRPQQGRKVIVIVSDGVDTVSNLDFDTTLQRMQAADCQFYAVHTGYIENANLRDLVAERRLQEFAAQTGGAVYVPKGTDDLDTAFAQISADLAQQYVLSYYPADERRDGRFRIITLRVKTRPNVRVRARKGYYAPKA